MMANLSSPILGVALLSSSMCCGGLPDVQPEPKPPEGQERYVVSATSLKIRTAPNAEATERGEVDHGQTVLVTGPSTGDERISGVHGGWAPVWWNGAAGYAFDGYLLPFPAPPAKCGGLADWAAAIGHAGSEMLVDHKSCASLQIGDEGDCETRYRTPLQGGGWFERMGGYEWNEDVLYLPGVPRDAFWAAARSCLAGLGMDFQRQPLPERSGPYASAPGDDADAHTVVSRDHWGWEWSDACSQYLYVEVTGRDARVVFGGGC